LRLPLIGSLVKLNTPPDGVEQHDQPLQAQDVLAGIQVLVVDDDKDTLDLLTAALTQRSASVTPVSSAAAAMDSIMASKPDVLSSDIAKPAEDGNDLIKKVIALDLAPKISAIAITAYAKEEDRERALSAGYQRYLSKPVELGEFILAVAEAAHTNHHVYISKLWIFKSEVQQVEGNNHESDFQVVFWLRFSPSLWEGEKGEGF
jgi:CheY-like chemotaxis protein